MTARFVHDERQRLLPRSSNPVGLVSARKALPAFGQTGVCTGRAGPVQSLSGGCRFASAGDEEWLCICGIG